MTNENMLSNQFNELGQPIGFPMADWQTRPFPPRATLEGKYCLVEPLNPARHAVDLYDAFSGDDKLALWTYLPYGPFGSFEAYEAWLISSAQSEDPLFFTIVDKATTKAIGLASYLRIDPAAGVIEVGHINYSPQLQKTCAATEAMYLMMKNAFDELGYRRYEWKCDALNAGSRGAAERYGFTFEGIFRQARIYKGRNRDTAWFAIIDSEWPQLKNAFEAWLSDANFDENGQQKASLGSFMTPPKDNA